MNTAIPEGIIKAATLASYQYVMIIIGVLVAFFFIVIIAKILPNRVQLFITGVDIKITKKYRFGDIIKINNDRWYIDHFNGYRITFRKVINWDKGNRSIELDQDEDLSIDYITFYKMKLHRLGNCRS